jgi:putative two-component system response regulator
MMKKKILVIDDNKSIICAVKEGLERTHEDYEVIGALSGKEGLQILTEGEKPDIILLDIMMPSMNGWDVFATLQEHQTWKDIPIVFLTAKTDDYSKGFGKLVCKDYIEKPFEVEDLKKRIDVILEDR